LNLYLEVEFPKQVGLPPVKALHYSKLEHVAHRLNAKRKDVYKRIQDSKKHHGFYSKGVFYVHPATLLALLKEDGIRLIKKEIKLNEELAASYGISLED
jgi:hypothetical protein